MNRSRDSPIWGLQNGPEVSENGWEMGEILSKYYFIHGLFYLAPGELLSQLAPLPYIGIANYCDKCDWIIATEAK